MKALRIAREILGLASAALVYYALGTFGLSLGSGGGHASPIWPASAFALTLVALMGPHYLLAIFVASFAVSVQGPTDLLSSVGLAVGHTLAAWVSTQVLSHFLRSHWFSFPREMVAYVAAGAGGGVVASAIGCAALAVSYDLSFQQLMSIGLTWWVGHTLGVLSLAPFLMLVEEKQGLFVQFDARMGERVLLYAAVLVVGYFGFSGAASSQLIFVLYLLMLAAVIRLGTADLKFLTLVITATSVYATVQGQGPFVIGSPHENLMCLQIFLSSIALTALCLCDFRNMGSLRYVVVSLLATWSLTAIVSFYVEASADQQDKTRMIKLGQQIVGNIKDRFRTYEDALRGGVGLFRASESVERREWAAYIEAAQFMDRYPGIHGVSAIWPVASDKVRQFEARQRRDEAPGFRVWAPAEWENPATGHDPRKERFVATLAEPAALANRTLGLDYGADPRRREIADLARDSGLPALSAQLALLGENRRAFLLFLPFYRSSEAPATIEERREKFMLWIVASFVSEEFFRELLGPFRRELKVTVFDGPQVDPLRFLYATNPPDDGGPPRLQFERWHTFVHGQHQFTLGLERAPGFLSAHDSTGAWIAALGAVVSLLMGGLVSVLGAMNRKAEEIAFQKTALLIKSESRVRELNRDLEERVFARTRELKNLNQRLIESETQFRELADSMPQIVWTARPDGYLDYFNKGWFDFTGFSSDDLGDTGWLSIMPEEDSRAFSSNWFNSVTGERTFEMELRLWDRSQQKYLWHLARAVGIRDESGKLIKWIGTSTNIHEHKTALEALKLSESRLVAMIDQSPIATQVIRRDGRVNRVNRAWLDLWNISPEDYQSQAFQDYNVLDDERLRRLGVTDYIQRAIGGEPVIAPMIQYSSEMPGQLERTRWMEIYFSPVREESGEIFEICLTYKDVSAQVEAMEQIRMKQAELEAIMDNSTAVIYLKDPEGRLLMVNNRYRRLLGSDHIPIIGKLESEIWPDGFANEFRERDLQVIRTRKPMQIEEVLEEKDGAHTYITSKFPIFDARGEIRAVCGISTDITEQLKSKEETALAEIRERSALEASRLKSEFLANMSHEIRTPINGIIGMAKLLSETEQTEEQRSFTQAITKSSGMLLTLVNDILDLSKVEAGKLELEVLPFSVEELVRDTRDSFEPLIKARGLSFRARMDVERDRFYLGDPSRIRQVLNNLISNAMKFTKTGQIGLDVTFAGRDEQFVELKFAVWDTGIGIPQDVTGRLFEKFSQGDSSTARKFGGTGLGLAICRRLVELMGGEIGVDSREGVGSNFHFTIKIRAADAEALTQFDRLRAEEAGQPLLVSDRGDLRILVAEDNSINQEITLRMLAKAGYKAEAVANGLEVLDSMAKMKYDLILMDCQMPEMDGYEAARELRRQGFTLPIIALTANAFKEDRKDCLDAGMSDYLAKPVTEEKLIRVLDRFLSHEKTQLLETAAADRAMLHRSEVIDHHILERLKLLDAEGERGFLRRLIKMYMDAMPKSLQDLRLEVEKASPQIPRIAHTLKSSSANLGVRRMVALLQKIEDGDYDAKDLPGLVDLLEEEFRRATEELAVELLHV